MCKVWLFSNDHSTRTCVQFEWADLDIAKAFVVWFNANNSTHFASIEAE